MFKKYIITGGVCLMTLFSVGYATSPTIAIDADVMKSAAALKSNFTPVNFIGPGNDFGGGIIWLTNKKLKEEDFGRFKAQGNIVVCSSQIRGFYFNSQRGDRLWPLDDDTAGDYILTKNDKKWAIEGGWYTDCEYVDKKMADKTFVEYSIFGNIEYKYNNDGNSKTYFNLVAGIDLNYDGNTIPENATRNHSLQYVNNTTPAGYIYDTAGGIAFVGGRVGVGDKTTGILINEYREKHKEFLKNIKNRNLKSVNGEITANGSSFNLFGGEIKSFVPEGALNTRLGIAVLGTMGVGHGYTSSIKRSILGNPGKQSSISEIASVNASDRYNTARKNAKKLCRGAKQKGGNERKDIMTYSNDIVCIKGENITLKKDKIFLKDTIGFSLGGKSLYIEKDGELGNLTIKQASENTQKTVDIFVDGGDVTISATNTIDISGQGFPVSVSSATRGLYLKGNLLIRGGIIGQVPHKFYLHGKFVSLNPVAKEGEKRKDRNNDSVNKKRKPLTSVFTRRCDPVEGKGGDSALCSKEDDRFALIPFVIIDQKYPTRFLTK